MGEIKHTAVIGAGLIGASWAALFAASGRSVAIYDPAPDAQKRVLDFIAETRPTLKRLGLAIEPRGKITFHTNPADAVAGADFIQENIPERLPMKHDIFAQIEPALDKNAIVASSASGLTLSQMQAGWNDPGNFILGHPFNPPHLIPLVEVMGNDKTRAGVVARAESFYTAIGKVTIRLNKEVVGHVANRLQAAIWQEAIHLAAEGVASVTDIDKAITAGPGLRWAAMGPSALFHLGAGDGGLEAFFDHFSDTFNGWWRDLGQVQIDDDIKRMMIDGVIAGADGRSVAELAAKRDALIIAMREAMNNSGL